MCMDVGGYRYKFKGFHENFIHPIFINEERMTTNQGAHVKFIETLFFLLFSRLVKGGRRDQVM